MGREKMLEAALRRAAGVIQGCHGALAKGINGEAIIALATADLREGETWGEACKRAEAQLADDWPNSNGR